MSSLEERVAALEARMAAMEGKPGVAPQPVAPAPAPASPKASWDFLIDSGEGWLGRAGVALLVVGFVLLFRYAVEQGWLTPGMRIAIGLITGAGLLFSGVSFFPERRRYRQILMGGGIVILFITGLAASELYDMISGIAALIFFVAVAGTAFTLAARQQDSIIASIGAVGALLPPTALLFDDVPGAVLFLYFAIIIAWTGTLMVWRGWEKALVIAAAASILAMLHEVPEALAVQTAAIIALAVCWICFAALPLLRARVFSAALLLVLPPLVTIALALVASEFVLERSYTFELSALLDALGFMAIAMWLRRVGNAGEPVHALMWRGETFRVHSYSAAASAAVLSLCAASIAGIEEPWFYAVIAGIAAGCVWFAKGLNAELLRPLGHLLFGLLGIGFVGVMELFDRLPAFDNYATSFALVTVLAVLVALRLPRADERLVYLCAAYLTLHILLATELADVSGAPWLASAAYGVVGSSLLVAGLSRRSVALQRAGMVSLAMLVGRLFLFDLSRADLGVRIIVFMIAGFAFLALSYLVKSRRFQAQ